MHIKKRVALFVLMAVIDAKLHTNNTDYVYNEGAFKESSVDVSSVVRYLFTLRTRDCSHVQRRLYNVTVKRQIHISLSYFCLIFSCLLSHTRVYF